jgi:hypothetical protein
MGDNENAECRAANERYRRGTIHTLRKQYPEIGWDHIKLGETCYERFDQALYGYRGEYSGRIHRIKEVLEQVIETRLIQGEIGEHRGVEMLGWIDMPIRF